MCNEESTLHVLQKGIYSTSAPTCKLAYENWTKPFIIQFHYKQSTEAKLENAVLNILAPNKRKGQHSFRAFTRLADRKGQSLVITKHNETSEIRTYLEYKEKINKALPKIPNWI
jgi:hypothetical protein